MTDIEKRATDFALKEIRCESVDELEQLGTEIAKKAFEEIRNDYIRMATEQKAIDIENVCKWVNDNKQPVLASDTDDTVVGYCISVEEFIEWLKTMEEE